MFKKYKGTIILTSVITVLPIIAGMILWDRLPDAIATHFDINNQPDGFGSKAFAVFGLPLIMLGLHLLCIAVTNTDPKKENISEKAISVVLWIIPLTSIVLMSLTYAYALGKEVRIGFAVLMLLGILFILLGNYMPKAKQNHTFGLRISWTLEDEENWNKTHRLAGKIFVFGGAIICVTAVFENPLISFPVLFFMAIAPIIYSYRLYKNKKDKE